MSTFFLCLVVLLSSFCILRSGSIDEHRSLANTAMRKVLDKNPEIRSLLLANGFDTSRVKPNVGNLVIHTLPGRNGKADTQITFGDLCLLAADSVPCFALDDAALRRLQALIISNVESRHDRRHFLVPAATYLQQCFQIPNSIGMSILPSVQDLDQGHSISSKQAALFIKPVDLCIPVSALANYALLHTRARALVANARVHREAKEQKSHLLLALLTLAYAEYFLHDVFSANHHIEDCIPVADKGAIGAEHILETNGCREYYRSVGTIFRFSESNTGVYLYGDGSFTPQQNGYAIGASYLSILEAFSLEAEYSNVVESFHSAIQSRDTLLQSYGMAFRYFPTPLFDNRYEIARTLHRSVLGPLTSISLSVVGSAKHVGVFAEVGAGMNAELLSLNIIRSNSAGIESGIVGFIYAAGGAGFVRQSLIAQIRAGAGLQLLDLVKCGVSWGPAVNSNATTFPVFIDAVLFSKPLDNSLGLEFLVSASLSRNAPYDVKMGLGFTRY